MIILVFGANSTLWGVIGLCRLAERHLRRLRAVLSSSVKPTGRHAAGAPPGEEVDVVVALRGGARRPRSGRLSVEDVAVLIAAHNESVVIADSLAAITELVPKGNVHVVSDGSTDDTEALAAATGVHVTATETNLGKAGALAYAIKEFGLVERFAVVMLLDADTRVQPGYFASALPLFDDLTVSAVAGAVGTAWARKLSAIGTLLVGHRTRIYSMAQRVLKFGQTWSRVNATYIVPGFASMYRSDVLPEIDMNPPGLVIEDFNMTFELYKKRLGKVGFSLSAVAVTQDPDTLRDYARQTKRWALGLWQTVRRHPPRFDLFSGMLAALLIELLTSSLVFLLLPILAVVLILPDFYGGALSLPVFAGLHGVIAAHVDLRDLLFGIVLPDYALTLLVATVERKPRLLLGGLFFLFLRIFDAGIALYTLPSAWLTKSNGRWQSPTRRALSADGTQNSEQSHAFVRGAKAG
ncbi:MAG TPA: glycosyltransferase family 2 protein [Pseudonocardiaceae bacterium]|jgi:cellulose synthase/poly-beta-1,6-N-acetylglucosamine synthase-like glycosyltransferase|nr:glycosyltransferase family 2 protein [Pseudonocardiaceae bacterium]